MTIHWAYIYEHPGSDPDLDRAVLDRAGQRTLLVPVPDGEQAPRVARRLVEEEGVTLVELCGGMPLAVAAAVADTVGPAVPVGHVVFAIDSVPGVARYSAAFDAAQREAGTVPD